MSYSYVQFGVLALPDLMPGDEVEETGLGPSRDGLITLPDGGWFDAYGEGLAPLDQRTVQAPATLMGETVADLDAVFQDWQALVGARAVLYRQWHGDGSEQWQLARLREVRVLGGGYTYRYLQVMLVFALLERAWHGDAHGANLLTNGGFDDGMTGWSVGFGTGDATVSDGYLTVLPHDGNDFIVEQTIAVEVGEDYVLAGKGKQATGRTAAIMLVDEGDGVVADGVWESLVAEKAAMEFDTAGVLLWAEVGGAYVAVNFDSLIAVKAPCLTALASSPEVFELPNAGNTLVRDLLITVHAGSSAITALAVQNAESGQVSHISFDGSLAAGEELVIDCGALSVLNDGDDAWADLALESDHAIDEWLRLAPGDNTITVTFTGGGTGAWIRFEYEDAWV